MTRDRWEDAAAYERYMGRWSRALAREFLGWLEVPAGAAWLEVGCGTGALTGAICEVAGPAAVVACDTANDYVTYCRERVRDPRLSVVPVPVDGYPRRDVGFDAVVSSLVLNFIPSPVAALGRMRETCAPGGCVAACVWDYAEEMEFLRRFWDTAGALDPAARELDEGRRFPICRPGPLAAAFVAAELEGVRVEPIRITTPFADFDDFWQPFLYGPGPAPTYVASLSDGARQKLAERLRDTLGPTWPIVLEARAWAVRGVRAG